ncbi:MAG: hypothetical protein WCE52_03790, partial [Candidatus Acidiferrum sp.]
MSRVTKTVAVFAILLVLFGVKERSAAAAPDDVNAVATTDAQIIKEIREHGELMDNLEYLSDRIGPRLTGSPLLKQANDWTVEMFKKYGLTNVHLE